MILWANLNSDGDPNIDCTLMAWFPVCFQSQEVDEVQSFIDAAIRLGFSPSKYKPLQLIGSKKHHFFEVFRIPLFSSFSLFLQRIDDWCIFLYFVFVQIPNIFPQPLILHQFFGCEAKSLVMALPWPTPWGAPGRAFRDEGVVRGGCLEVAATHRRCREKWNRCGWNTASSLLNWIWRCLLQWTMCWTCHFFDHPPKRGQKKNDEEKSNKLHAFFLEISNYSSNIL